MATNLVKVSNRHETINAPLNTPHAPGSTNPDDHVPFFDSKLYVERAIPDSDGNRRFTSDPEELTFTVSVRDLNVIGDGTLNSYGHPSRSVQVESEGVIPITGICRGATQNAEGHGSIRSYVFRWLADGYAVRTLMDVDNDGVVEPDNYNYNEEGWVFQNITDVMGIIIPIDRVSSDVSTKRYDRDIENVYYAEAIPGSFDVRFFKSMNAPTVRDIQERARHRVALECEQDGSTMDLQDFMFFLQIRMPTLLHPTPLNQNVWVNY